MGSMSFTFDTWKFEQEIKRQAEEEKRIAIAKSVVERQPIIGGLRIMDKNSEEILKILLEMHRECNSYDIQGNYNKIPKCYHSGLTQIFDTLQQSGMIFNHTRFLGGFYLSLSPIALTYFEDKEKALKAEEEKQMAQNISIQHLTATGSNINFGTISNSTVTAQNIVSEIEQQIEEQGGEDKDELKNLLEEVKELCEDIKSNMPLPKRAPLMNRISNHLAKHGWFYGAVVQLIGNTAIMAMAGK